MGPQELPRDDPEAEQPQASPKRYRHTDVSLTCPSCGFSGLYRSHARTRTEHLWKRLSDQRLHLCPKCKWRGWQMPVPKPQDPRRLFPDAAHPDLGLIDRVLHGSSSTSGIEVAPSRQDRFLRGAQSASDTLRTRRQLSICTGSDSVNVASTSLSQVQVARLADACPEASRPTETLPRRCAS